ncbi:hypothetical protein ACERII_17030 [Evansella sp. AB-rgal1]
MGQYVKLKKQRELTLLPIQSLRKQREPSPMLPEEGMNNDDEKAML